MTTATNMIIRDDAATPADHTLLPVYASDKGFQLRENAAGVPVDGQIRLTGAWERLKNGTYRMSIKLEVPVMETIGSSAASGYVANAKVAYVNVGIVTLFAPARSSIADRANTVRMLTHALQGATATAAGGVDSKSASGALFSGIASASQIPYSLVNLFFPQ